MKGAKDHFYEKRKNWIREPQILIDPNGSHPKGNFGWQTRLTQMIAKLIPQQQQQSQQLTQFFTVRKKTLKFGWISFSFVWFEVTVLKLDSMKFEI